MKRTDRSSHTLRLAVLALAVCTLAGCDTLNDWFSTDRVNYKDAGSAPALAIPPDLAAVPVTSRYSAPATTAGLGDAPQRAKTAAGNLTEGVPSQQDALGMHVEQDGNRRWLVIDGRTPGQLWPQLEEFWAQNGFVLTTDAPDTGIMQTDWAENRANIPNDWFRRTIGKVIDFAYSSGTRDRFNTLVERGASGSTDIFVTHQAMEEVLIGQDKDTSRWADRPRNPELESEFLSKMMLKFGLTDAQAQQLIATARPGTSSAQLVPVGGGAPTLDLQEPFERSWLRVGLALDRTNFTVDNRDHDKGLYYVRYSDPNEEMEGNGLFSKLFSGGAKKKQQAGSEYLVTVRPNGAQATQVAVVDTSGQPDASPAAKRIVTLLHSQLN